MTYLCLHQQETGPLSSAPAFPGFLLARAATVMALNPPVRPQHLDKSLAPSP